MNEYLARAQEFFYQHTGDADASREMALEMLASLREQQSSSLAYFDVFWVGAALALGLVVLVLFMKRSVAEKGAHLAAE